MDKEFVSSLRNNLIELRGEIDERNDDISERDSYIYGDKLETSLDIPIGHDFTPVNWLRRSVEIHKIQFMGRPFQVVSTYNTVDESSVDDPQEQGRLHVENKKRKEFAEMRQNLINDVIRDNGGHSLFADGAESASAAGSFIIKSWYDTDLKKWCLIPVEAVENCYAIWSDDNFREYDAFAFIYQVSKAKAIEKYGVDEDVATSKLGDPLDYVGTNVNSSNSTQSMVTIMEVTGKIPGWGVTNGKLVKTAPGTEDELNALIVGNEVIRLTDKPKEIPKYYILPNKRQRRRPWGFSDISDAAIQINLTYVETLSDWRTVASKVNFPKFKGFNFGPDTQMPKYKSRQVQFLPLLDGQDVVPLAQGDANQVDFKAQLDELKEQFVRETGISRVLFDDPSITLNSNQALLTSMKPTSDIAESKKQIWEPILARMFTDIIEGLAEWDSTVKDLADNTDDNWNLKIQWPSVMQKEDPVYQNMLINRKNAGTISIQSYLEAQGESKEEIDRIREEMKDPITAAIHGNQLSLVAQQTIAPVDPNAKDKPKVSVSLRGDLSPAQEATIAQQEGWNPTGEMGPQGTAGLKAYENTDNVGLINGNPFQGGTATPKSQAQITAPNQNQPGQQPMSQPGSGATTASPEGALAATAQQQGA